MKSEDVQLKNLKELKEDQTASSSSNTGRGLLSKPTARKSFSSQLKTKPAFISEKRRQSDNYKRASAANKDIDPDQNFPNDESALNQAETEPNPEKVFSDNSSLPHLEKDSEIMSTSISVGPKSPKSEDSEISIVPLNVTKTMSSVEEKTPLVEKESPKSGKTAVADEDLNSKVWKNIAQDLEDISSDSFDSSMGGVKKNDAVDDNDLTKEDEALAVKSMILDLEEEEPSDWEDREPLEDEMVDHDLPSINIESVGTLPLEVCVLSSDDEGAGGVGSRAVKKKMILDVSDEEGGALQLETESTIEEGESNLAEVEDISDKLDDESAGGTTLNISEVLSLGPKDSLGNEQELPSDDLKSESLIISEIKSNCVKNLDEDPISKGDNENLQLDNNDGVVEGALAADEIAQDIEEDGKQVEGQKEGHDDMNSDEDDDGLKLDDEESEEDDLVNDELRLEDENEDEKESEEMADVESNDMLTNDELPKGELQASETREEETEKSPSVEDIKAKDGLTVPIGDVLSDDVTMGDKVLEDAPMVVETTQDTPTDCVVDELDQEMAMVEDLGQDITGADKLSEVVDMADELVDNLTPDATETDTFIQEETVIEECLEEQTVMDDTHIGDLTKGSEDAELLKKKVSNDELAFEEPDSTTEEKMVPGTIEKLEDGKLDSKEKEINNSVEVTEDLHLERDRDTLKDSGLTDQVKDGDSPVNDKDDYLVMDDRSQDELVINEELDEKPSEADSKTKPASRDAEPLEVNSQKSTSQSSKKTKNQKSVSDSVSDGTDETRLQLDFSSDDENGVPSVKANDIKVQEELSKNDSPLRKRTTDDVNLDVFVTEEIPAKKPKIDDSPIADEKVSVNELQDIAALDEYKPFVVPTDPRKVTISEIEALIKERIFHYVDERNKMKMEALLEKCEQLEKQVERWKKRASYLETQVKEAEAEIDIYKQSVAANKPPQSNSTTSNTEVAASKPAPPTISNTFSRKSTTTVHRNYQTQGSIKKPETPVKPNSGIPVPLALIANTALTPTKQTKTTTVVQKNPSKSATIIDLTEEEEEKSTKALASPKGVKVISSISSTLPTCTSLLQTSPSRPNVTVSYQPIVSSGQVMTLPMLSGGSMVQLIPSGTATIPTGANIASGVRMSTNVRGQTFANAPAGTQVAYLLQNGPGLPNQPGLSTMNRHVLALPSPGGLIQNPRPGQLQTILLMRNPVTSTGISTGARYQPPIAGMRHSVATTSHVNSNPAVNTIPVGSTGLSISLSKPQAAVVPQLANPVDQRNKTPLRAPVMNLSLATGTSVTTMPNRHPAPLPPQPVYKSTPSMKLLPPRPALKISKVANGIVLSWNMTINATHAAIVSYQLYAYQESANVPSTSLWKKVGDVKALPLPMACTLTQFVEGNRYHFAVRAVDNINRCGPYSEPTHIVLPSKK